jgi:hypothetical protein
MHVSPQSALIVRVAWLWFLLPTYCKQICEMLIGKPIVGWLPVTFFLTKSLDMPLIANDQSGLLNTGVAAITS